MARRPPSAGQLAAAAEAASRRNCGAFIFGLNSSDWIGGKILSDIFFFLRFVIITTVEGTKYLVRANA